MGLSHNHWKQAVGVILTFSLVMVLFVSNLTKAQAADEYDSMRAKWYSYLTGGTYDQADPDIAVKITQITNNAQKVWNSMDKSAGRTYLWSDLSSQTITPNITTTYGRLETMALAYRTVGSSLQNNATLLSDILSALDWLNANNWYSARIALPTGTNSVNNNWWDWEIGTPQNLKDITVLLYDQLTSTQISTYMNAIDHFVGDCSQNLQTVNAGVSKPDSGANLAWKCSIQILRGVIIKDSAVIADGRSKISPLFDNITATSSTNDGGFFADGSYIQHYGTAYNGGYGLSLLETISEIVYLLDGSTWEYTNSNLNNLYQWVYNSYQPLIYRGALMDMVRGREISRNTTANGATGISDPDHQKGQEFITALVTIIQFAPPQDAAKYKAMIKGTIQADTYSSYMRSSAATLYALTPVKTIANDSTIPAEADQTTHRTYASMDRIVHQRPDYAFGISMFSSRIFNYESINNGNLHGWYTGSGMTYLYTAQDLGQYSDSYWPTVNPYRLPGTTVDTMTRADSSNQHTNSNRNWVGGVTLDGLYGAAGMDQAEVAAPSTLTAKKSWFMFDDEMVALGAGITDSSANHVETTIDNRKITGSETLTVDGVAMPSTLGWSEAMTGVNWMQLDTQNIGYYFPGGTTVSGLRETRTGAWRDIDGGGSATAVSRNYLTLFMNHGVAPTDSKYSYVVLPNKTSSQVRDYASHPGVTILANTDRVQAVKQISLNMIGANFWADQPTTLQVDGKDYLTSDRQASVMTQASEYGLKIAISDPTQANKAGSGIIDDNAQDYSQIYDRSTNMIAMTTGGFRRKDTNTGYVTYKLGNIKDFTASVRYLYQSTHDSVPLLQRVHVYVSPDNNTFTLLPVKFADPNYVPQSSYSLGDPVDLIPDVPIPLGTNYVKVEFNNLDTRFYSPVLSHMHIDGESPIDGYTDIEIHQGAEYVGSLDPNITVLQLYPSIKLRVKVEGTQGRSLQASFYGQPPVTTATLTPGLNSQGWTNQDMTVSLSAQDEAGGSGVATVTYRADGAQTIPFTAIDGASASFTIGQEGKTTATYYATDHAGDQEQPKTVQINLDKTAPTLDLSGTGAYTVDQNVSVVCQASDALSGLASDPCGIPLAAGTAYQFGLGPHTVTAAVYDNAGNGTAVSGTFQVNVTFDSLAKLTQTFVKSGGSNGAEGIAHSLTVKLENAGMAAQAGDAEASRNLIAAYENDVAAQSGKAVNEAQAAVLTTLAKALTANTL